MAKNFRFWASVSIALALTLSCSNGLLGGLGGLGESENNESNGSIFSGGNRLINSSLNFAPSSGIPEGNDSIITGVRFIAAAADDSIGTLIFTSKEELVELYLQVGDEGGYYKKTLDSSDISNKAGANDYSYSVDLDFAPGLDVQNQNIKVSGKSKADSTISAARGSENSLIEEFTCGQDKNGYESGFIGRFDMRRDNNEFKFTYDTKSVPDEITIYEGSKGRGDSAIFRYSGSSFGTKTAYVRYERSPISVKVVGSGVTTSWNFKVYCP